MVIVVMAAWVRWTMACLLRCSSLPCYRYDGGCQTKGARCWQTGYHGGAAGISSACTEASVCSSAGACIFVVSGFLIVQFVDDSFTMQSTAFGLRAVNKALCDFGRYWRHRFKVGEKGPMVLPVGAYGVDGSMCGVVEKFHRMA